MNGRRDGCRTAHPVAGTGWIHRSLAVAVILVPIVLQGCKTVRYTAPPAELAIPVATEAAAIPTLTQVQYRALGKVPYRSEIT